MVEYSECLCVVECLCLEGDYWGGACGCLVGNVYIEFGVWIEFLKE